MHVAALTRKIYHVKDNDEITCNESNPSRKLRDNTDEKRVVELLHQAANVCNVNQQPTVPKRLQNIIPKDVATTSIEESLLKANSLGQERQVTFLKEGLMMPKDDGHRKKLGDPLPKIYKAPRFSSFCEVKKKESEKSATIKADRNIFQRNITAYDAGRSVDLARILRHELMQFLLLPQIPLLSCLL